jgi:hypothetical protein
MEYNASTKNKPNNVLPIHKKHEEWIQEKMSFMSAKREMRKEDERFWIKDEYSIQISGSGLKDCGGNLFLWRRLAILTKNDNADIILKSVLFDLGIDYFYDQDAQGGGLFTGKNDWCNFAYCYISPDFPEGYAQNHSLEHKANQVN